MPTEEKPKRGRPKDRLKLDMSFEDAARRMLATPPSADAESATDEVRSVEDDDSEE